VFDSGLLTPEIDTMPRISIILPVYNVGRYLEAALSSLTSQTMNNIEIIAVNDGSTDNSEEILQRYQEKYDSIAYYNQSNSGQSAARNHALRYANGEYVYFMDSDDIIDTDALRVCYEYAEHTKADFIFFDGDTIQEEGATSITWDYKRTYLVEENIRYDGETLLNTMLDKEKHNCVVWLLFIRRAFLDRIGLRFYEGIIHEDELYTTILTLSSDNIYCLKRCLVKHRVRSTSTMGKQYSKRNINCYLTVADELLRYSNAAIIHKFLRYTLSKVFYTGFQIPFKEKPLVFLRAVKSGYLKYIGFRPAIVFWFKRK